MLLSRKLKSQEIFMRKIVSFTVLLSIIFLTFQTEIIYAQKFRKTENGETILQTATVNLPLSGVSFTESKILDPKKGSLTARATDKNGRQVNAEKLRSEEGRLYRQKYGKLQPAVYEALRSRKGADKITVGFCVKIPGLPGPNDVNFGGLDVNIKEVRAFSERNDRVVDGAVKKAAAPLIELLAKMKRLPENFDSERSVSPVISATVTVDELKELIKREDVLTVFLEEQKLKEFLNSSAKTMNVPSVWANGITGSGIRVAVVDRRQVDFTNSALSGANGGSFDPNGAIAAHPTMVAGIIAAGPFTDGGLQHQGIAYGASIYSADADWIPNKWNVHSAIDGAVPHADIFNFSWGDDCNISPAGWLDSFGYHADFIVRRKRKGITAAVGNSGNVGSCNRIGSVAASYNVTVVGSYDDHNTGLNLMDDQMSAFSSFGFMPFGDPVDGIKPDVVAPGENITSTSTGQSYATASGTSFSSAMVAGTEALLLNAKPGLINRPEVVKAIIVASAVHNIEGDAQLSLFDGAGGVDAKVAFETAVNNRFYWNVLLPSSFGNQTPSPYMDINMGPIPAGHRVKAACAWDSSPTNWAGPVSLGIDLDLTVFDPQMNPVGGDGRWSDSKETAQFYTTSTAPGNYTLRIYRYSWDQSVNPWTFLGTAWSIS
jgi:hypothetical protein